MLPTGVNPFVARCVVERSVYAPRPDYAPPEPEWKSREDVRDAVPRRRPTRNGKNEAGRSSRIQTPGRPAPNGRSATEFADTP